MTPPRIGEDMEMIGKGWRQIVKGVRIVAAAVNEDKRGALPPQSRYSSSIPLAVTSPLV